MHLVIKYTRARDFARQEPWSGNFQSTQHKFEVRPELAQRLTFLLIEMNIYQSWLSSPELHWSCATMQSSIDVINQASVLHFWRAIHFEFFIAQALLFLMVAYLYLQEIINLSINGNGSTEMVIDSLDVFFSLYILRKWSISCLLDWIWFWARCRSFLLFGSSCSRWTDMT